MTTYFIHPDSFTSTLSSDGEFGYAVEMSWDLDGKVASYYDPDPPPSILYKNHPWYARHFSTSSSRIGGYELQEHDNLNITDFSQVMLYTKQVAVPYEISDQTDQEILDWFDDWWWNDRNRNDTGALDLMTNASPEAGDNYSVVYLGNLTKRYVLLIAAKLTNDLLGETLTIEHYPTSFLSVGPVSPKTPVVTATVITTKDLEMSANISWSWSDDTWVNRLVGYEIQRAIDSSEEPDYLQVTDPIADDITTYKDDTTPFNEYHVYNYRVRALTDLGIVSPWGNIEIDAGVNTPPLTGVRIFYGLNNASMRTKTGVLDNEEYKFLKYTDIGRISGLGATAVIEGRTEPPRDPAADQILAINYESEEPLVFGPLKLGNIQITAGVAGLQVEDFMHPSLTALSGVGDFAIVSNDNDYDYVERSNIYPDETWPDWDFPAELPMLLL